MEEALPDEDDEGDDYDRDEDYYFRFFGPRRCKKVSKSGDSGVPRHVTQSSWRVFVYFLLEPGIVTRCVQDFDGDYHGSEAFELKGSEELAMDSERKAMDWSCGRTW